MTTGSTSSQFPSYFPRDVLIGTVSNIDLGEGSLDSRIRVEPAVDLGNLERVEVLTGVDVALGHMTAADRSPGSARSPSSAWCSRSPPSPRSRSSASRRT